MPDKNIDILLIGIILQHLLPSKLQVSDYYTTKMTGPLVTINIQELTYQISF